MYLEPVSVHVAKVSYEVNCTKAKTSDSASAQVIVDRSRKPKAESDKFKADSKADKSAQFDKKVGSTKPTVKCTEQSNRKDRW